MAEKYLLDDVRDIRQDMITLRDEALNQSDMQWSVRLSHTVAVLGQMIETMETDNENCNCKVDPVGEVRTAGHSGSVA